MPAWNSFIKCCGPQAVSWLEALDRESQIQHGVAAFRGHPGIKGLFTLVVRGLLLLLLDNGGTCTKSRLGPWGRSGIGQADRAGRVGDRGVAAGGHGPRRYVEQRAYLFLVSIETSGALLT